MNAIRSRRPPRADHLENYRGAPSPPFLILFINSICNQKCEHCFYWRNLNRRDDLTKDEIFALSRSLGRIENLNLSGGEPFLRPEFGEICRQFIRHNGARQIYVPTNGSFTDKTVDADHDRAQGEGPRALRRRDLARRHARVPRQVPRAPTPSTRPWRPTTRSPSCRRAIPRLRIHAISTATDVNMDEIRRLTTYLFDRCPEDGSSQPRDHPRRPQESVAQGPKLQGVPGALRVRPPAVGDPRARAATGRSSSRCCSGPRSGRQAHRHQVVPCRAGSLDRRRLRQRRRQRLRSRTRRSATCASKPFPEIWNSAEAQALRQSIRAGSALHQRGVPLAEHHLPAAATGASDGRGQAVAGRAAAGRASGHSSHRGVGSRPGPEAEAAPATETRAGPMALPILSEPQD